MIKVNDKWAIEWDTGNMNCSPYIWQESREVKNRKTGEVSVKEAQWEHTGLYFSNVQGALMEIVRQGARGDIEMQDIKEYVKSIQEAIAKVHEDIRRLE